MVYTNRRSIAGALLSASLLILAQPTAHAFQWDKRLFYLTVRTKAASDIVVATVEQADIWRVDESGVPRQTKNDAWRLKILEVIKGDNFEPGEEIVRPLARDGDLYMYPLIQKLPSKAVVFLELKRDDPAERIMYAELHPRSIELTKELTAIYALGSESARLKRLHALCESTPAKSSHKFQLWMAFEEELFSAIHPLRVLALREIVRVSKETQPADIVMFHLGELHDIGAVPYLVEKLESDNEGLQYAAASVLIRYFSDFPGVTQSLRENRHTPGVARAIAWKALRWMKYAMVSGVA